MGGKEMTLAEVLAFGSSDGEDRGAMTEAKVNQALVRLLENALNGAKAGSFVGGGLVLATSDRNFVHFANVGAFDNFVPVIAGTSILLADLQITMRNQQQNNANRLLRAHEMPSTKQ